MQFFLLEERARQETSLSINSLRYWNFHTSVFLYICHLYECGVNGVRCEKIKLIYMVTTLTILLYGLCNMTKYLPMSLFGRAVHYQQNDTQKLIRQELDCVGNAVGSFYAKDELLEVSFNRDYKMEENSSVEKSNDRLGDMYYLHERLQAIKSISRNERSVYQDGRAGVYVKKITLRKSRAGAYKSRGSKG